jgi:hypothetical protein
LKEHFRDEVFHLDALLSFAVSELWGYSDYASAPVSDNPVRESVSGNPVSDPA